MAEIVNKYQYPDFFMEKLQSFTNMVLYHNENSLNLIGENTIANFQERHLDDSLQVAEYIKNHFAGNIVDLGSGAGFPLIPTAILLESEKRKFYAIEKSSKKFHFLSLVKNNLGLSDLTILNDTLDRIDLSQYEPSVITARAFKPLSFILSSVVKLREQPTLLLLKGEKLEEEITEAKKLFDFEYEAIRSVTGVGYLLIIKRYK